MITLVSMSPAVQLLPLCCAVPVEDAPSRSLADGTVAVPAERVLTLQPFAKRENLPEAVLDSPAVRRAVENGALRVIHQTPTTPVRAKTPSSPPAKTQRAAPSKTGGAKRSSTPREGRPSDSEPSG